MKPKASASKWNSFVATDPTNNTPWTAVENINGALRAAGLNVSRISIIQSGVQFGGAEEMNSHEFLADPTFSKEAPLQYFGDFQEPHYRQFNYGDALDWIRHNTPQNSIKNLGGVVINWLVFMYQQVYDSGNMTPGPTNIPQLPTVDAYAAIIEANPDAKAAIVKRVLPLLEAALEADGGL